MKFHLWCSRFKKNDIWKRGIVPVTLANPQTSLLMFFIIYFLLKEIVPMKTIHSEVYGLSRVTGKQFHHHCQIFRHATSVALDGNGCWPVPNFGIASLLFDGLQLHFVQSFMIQR